MTADTRQVRGRLRFRNGAHGYGVVTKSTLGVGLVLEHTVVRRNRHLGRML
jgi:hypothetical protein